MADLSQVVGTDPARGAPRTRLVALLVGPYRVLRGNRPLGLLVVSHALATLGAWFSLVTLAVLVYALSHSATVVALMTFVHLVPYAAFTPLGGMLIDRWDRTRLVVGANLGCALCMVGLISVDSPQTLWRVFPLIFVAFGLISLLRPTVNTVLPTLVAEGDRETANSLIGQLDSLADMVGPLLSSVLVLLGHLQLAFVLCTVAFGAAAVAFKAARVPPPDTPPTTEDEGRLGAVLAGFRFLFQENEHVLAACVLPVSSVLLLTGAWWSLIVVLSVQSFHLGAQGTGFLEAVYASGGLLGGFLVLRLSRRLPLGGVLILGVALSALATALFGLSPAGLWPFALMTLMGVGDLFLQVNATTILQAATPSTLLGRAFSAFEATVLVAEVLGALLVGPLIGVLGPRLATVAFAVTTMLVLALAVPRLRRLEAVLGVRLYLRQVPVFAMLSRRTLDDLGGRLHLERFASGTAIVREGDVGERLYMIRRGEVLVLVRGDRPHAVPVATLSMLDYFGEIALVQEVPRTATVRAQGPVEAYSLDRADFQALLRRSTELQQALHATAEARRHDTQIKLALHM